MSQDKGLDPISEMEAEIENYKVLVTRSDLTTDFMKSDFYELVLKKVFIDGYRNTAQSNCALFNIQQTENFVHGMKARAYLEDFFQRQLEEGLVAEVAIKEIEEEIKIAKKAI